MKSNPEEFFRGEMKWQFMYEVSFREVLTEAEKDALQEALQTVRRHEFDTIVIEELTRDKDDFRYDNGGYTLNSSNHTMRIDSSGGLGIGTSTHTTFKPPTLKPNIQIGSQTLNEEDIKNLKASMFSWGVK
jgi:hypothetical protein